MKRNITVLMTIFIALVFSLSTTYVMPAKAHAGWGLSSHDDNLNDNDNDDDSENDNENDNDNDNENDNDNDSELKVYGTITSIDYNSSKFQMEAGGGQRFDILADSAQIKAEHVPCAYWLTFGDLKVGHFVKVEGWRLLNGTLQAYEVEVYNYICPGATTTTTTTIPTTTTTIPGQPILTVRVRGKIKVIIPDSDDPEEGKLVVKGELIEVSSSTRFKGPVTSFSGLSVGQRITANGKRETVGEIKARVIKTK